jgi:hypothetical protein
MTSRPRPLWPWIAAKVIAVPVLYVASFGPACWIVARPEGPTVRSRRMLVVYWPLGRAALQSNYVGDAIEWWMTAGLSDSDCIAMPTTPRQDDPQYLSFMRR